MPPSENLPGSATGSASEPLFDVFLSHNSRDKACARELAEKLDEYGVRVWLDERELVPGRPWLDTLETTITTTRSAAVLFGPAGLGPWEKPEMRACLSEFVERKLPVILVLLDGLDQASPEGRPVAVLRDLIRDVAWNSCRVVVSGRPHGLQRHWDELFADSNRSSASTSAEPPAAKNASTCFPWKTDDEYRRVYDLDAPPDSSARVLRGGSWSNNSSLVRSAYRLPQCSLVL